MSRDHGYINISKPQARSPGLSHDLQLLRDLEIANARTVAELGSLPPGGLPMQPKRKPDVPYRPLPAPTNHETTEDEAMKWNQVAAVTAMAAGMAACEPAPKTDAAEQPPATTPANSQIPPVSPEARVKPKEAQVSEHETIREFSGLHMNENESNELESFIPSGARKLAAAKGDINSDGRQDALLIIDYPGTGNEKLGEGLPRSLLLLVRDDSGALRKVAQNNKLIPCAECGGIWGDPFSSIHAENGSFTLVVEGGSRWHWFNEYTFRYDPRRNDWFPKKIRKAVVDRLTTEAKVIDLIDSKAPNVSFSDLDPATLPSVEM